MKIEQIKPTNKYREENNYQDYILIKINGVDKFFVRDGEPEDATLSRDFSDCRSVLSLIKEAYEAGKRGEPLDVIESLKDGWEY